MNFVLVLVIVIIIIVNISSIIVIINVIIIINFLEPLENATSQVLIPTITEVGVVS